MNRPAWHDPRPEGPPARPLPLTERRLGPHDLARVLALHDAVHRAAPVEGLFVRETPGFFAAHLGRDGHILGLEAPDGTLVCYGVLGLPQADADENFGHDLGLTAADRARVCHLDGTAVLPALRGRGLQRHMTRRRLALARAAGRDIALSTAAPGNAWSLANLTAEGLRVVALLEKYTALRLMLRADAAEPAIRAPVGPEARAVPLDASASCHGALLAAGWQGVAVHHAAEGPTLVYAPPGGGHGPCGSSP